MTTGSFGNGNGGHGRSAPVNASSLNPDAGSHPVPTDPQVLGAALRAAERCWQRFPYWELRYGERGRRFGDSDTAWLATLPTLETDQLITQVEWLAGVLAARGMPSLLLKVQLELLVEELHSARPSDQQDSAKLLEAVAALDRNRREQLSDEAMAALNQAFDSSAPAPWNEKLPETGTLICCAVADERAGFAGAERSLLDWLTDPERFPREWIECVQRTVADARAKLAAV